MRCTATTQAGRQCKNTAIEGTEHCKRHTEGEVGGRGPKLTEEVHDAIVRSIGLGNYATVAAGTAGIHTSTFYAWIQQGERDRAAGVESIYSAFSDAVKKAEDEAEAAAVTHVRAAMRDSWQAAMTYLERKHPKRWGRKDRHEVTGAEGGPIEISEAALQDPELRKDLRSAGRRLAADRARRAGEPGSAD